MIGAETGVGGIVSTALLLLAMIPIAVACWRMIVGPTIVDRVVALDMLTGIAVSVAAFVAAATMRREFLDVGFGAALISFVGIIALSRFIERKGRRKK